MFPIKEVIERQINYIGDTNIYSSIEKERVKHMGKLVWWFYVEFMVIR